MADESSFSVPFTSAWTLGGASDALSSSESRRQWDKLDQELDSLDWISSDCMSSSRSL